MSAASAAGEGLDDVANLRDVHEVEPDVIVAGKLYRCSCLFDEALIRKLGIRTLFDLRRKNKPPVVELSDVTRVYVPLIDSEAGIALLRSFPLGVKLELAFTWPVRGFSKQVGEHLFKDASTLNNLYNVILDYAKKPIQTVFAELSNAANYPVMVHCVAGKDRTGIIVALLLRLCDVSHEKVIADYARSEGFLSVVLETEDVRGNTELLNPKAIKSPPEALGRALKRVEDRHGSIRRYLEKHVRIPPATLDQVRANIMVNPAFATSAAPRPPTQNADVPSTSVGESTTTPPSASTEGPDTTEPAHPEIEAHVTTQ